MGKKKKANKKSAHNNNASGEDGNGLMVDPARVRFQHSRIRPYFSGCGRSVLGTLEEIRQGKLSPSDLPPIQVIVGPNTKDGPNYFSLNNRRLWVLKECRKEGLLLPTNNQILVRVRKPKSDQEAARYSIQNCALEAKMMLEKPKAPRQQREQVEPDDNGLETKLLHGKMDSLTIGATEEKNPSEDTSEEGDESSDDEPAGPTNRFSALF